MKQFIAGLLLGGLLAFPVLGQKVNMVPDPELSPGDKCLLQAPQQRMNVNMLTAMVQEYAGMVTDLIALDSPRVNRVVKKHMNNVDKIILMRITPPKGKK